MNTCLKCGKRFKPRDKKYQTQVARELCIDCEAEWHKFYAQYSKQLEIVYPHVHNPAWDVFLGRLEDLTPEVVQFT